MTGLIDIHGKKLETARCNVGTCDEPAAYQVGALLWASGMRKGSHEPIPVLSSLVCCAAHKSFPTIKNVFTPEVQKTITDNIIRQGKRAPDFATAEIHLSPIKR